MTWTPGKYVRVLLDLTVIGLLGKLRKLLLIPARWMFGRRPGEGDDGSPE